MRLEKGVNSLSISDIGATVTRWQWGERHLFFQQQNTLNRAGVLRNRGGCYIAAPVFGQTPQSLERGLPKHGIIRTSLACLGRFEDGAKWEFCSSDNTRACGEQYGFAWELTAQIQLTKNGFGHEIEVQRLAGSRHMPFNVGIHPYFPAANELRIGDYYEKLKDLDLPNSMLGRMPESGLLQVGFDFGTVVMRCTGYDWVNVWTDHGGKYLCVEPLWDHPRRWDVPGGKELKAGRDNSIRLTCSFEFAS